MDTYRLGGMAQRTIYLPADLDERLQHADFSVSRVCREALEAELRLRELQRVSVPRGAEQTSECQDGRHVGPVRHLGYVNVCDACGKPWQEATSG